jgi:Peptidase family M3
MDLKQWCEIDERIYIADADERYKQYAGFDYSEAVIEQLADMKLRNAQIFLRSFSEPREIYLNTIESIADSKTKKLELKLHNLKNKKIISSKYKFDNFPVNWSTWRQFNSIEKDSLKRKHVFDEFIAKTKYIAPTIERRFSIIKEVYSEYGRKSNSERGRDEDNNNNNDRISKGNDGNEPGKTSKTNMSPLDGYLENEKLSYSQLIQFVKSMGEQAKKPFREALTNISEKILGREAEYYDDFYFFRNRVYSDIEKHFSEVDPLLEVKKTLELMQFDLSKINFDVDNRKNKYPSPICFFIQVPNDIRILYKTESPYFDLQGCFHETGHAIHATSIDASLEYWNRYSFSMGIAEIFSILIERLTKNNNYLESVLGIKDENILHELASRNNFMELFFITFYTANSLMKAEYWHKNLSIEDANVLYSKLIKEYTGFEMPGEYWMLHHILPDAIMYVPSYLLAAVRAKELDIYLQNKFGENWWADKNAGNHLREIMKPGAKIELERFSKLDINLFTKEIISM